MRTICAIIKQKIHFDILGRNQYLLTLQTLTTKLPNKESQYNYTGKGRERESVTVTE